MSDHEHGPKLQSGPFPELPQPTDQDRADAEKLEALADDLGSSGINIYGGTYMDAEFFRQIAARLRGDA